MSKGLVTIFGGSGFLGRYAARALVRQGWRVRIACRQPGLAGDARLAGSAPGWVDIAPVNISNRASIAEALRGSDAAVNLVGILHERGRQTFENVHVAGAENIADMAREAGIARFVHVSALGADPDSKIRYVRTKGEGEAKVRRACPQAVILRPSVVFGPEDRFFNRFAELARRLPFLPAIGGGRTRLQPVYAGDVADAICAAVNRPDAAGNTYALAGPETCSLKDIYDFIMKVTDRRRLTLPVPFFMAQPAGYVCGAIWHYLPPFSWGFFGDPPVTGNQIQMLRSETVADADKPGLAELGIDDLETIEAITPAYLWRYRAYGEFHRRREA